MNNEGRNEKDKDERCPVCGAPLGEDRFECEVCHTKLGPKIEPEKILCRECGAVLEREAIVCYSCGVELGEGGGEEALNNGKEAITDAFMLIPGIDHEKAEHLYSIGYHNLLDLIGGSLGDDLKSVGMKRELAKNILARRGLPEAVGKKRCPECEIPMEESDTICGACGAKFVKDEDYEEKIKCPECNTPLTEDAIFCYACGEELEEGSEVHEDEFALEKKLLKEGLMHLADGIMEKLMIYCPICREKNSPSSVVCVKCGCELESEDREYSIRQFMTLPGIGRDQAEILYRRGFRDLNDLIESLLDEDAKARGIGWNLEKKIMLSHVKMMEGDMPGEMKIFCPKCRTMYIFVSRDITDCEVCKYKKLGEDICKVCIYKMGDDKYCNICNALLKADEELESEIEDIKMEIGKIVGEPKDIIGGEGDAGPTFPFLPSSIQEIMKESFMSEEMDEVDEILSAAEKEMINIPESERKELAVMEEEIEELIDGIKKHKIPDKEKKQMAKVKKELGELMDQMAKKEPGDEEKVKTSMPLRKGLYFATALLNMARSLKLGIQESLMFYRQAITAVKLKQYRKALELTKESVIESIRTIKDGRKIEVNVS